MPLRGEGCRMEQESRRELSQVLFEFINARAPSGGDGVSGRAQRLGFNLLACACPLWGLVLDVFGAASSIDCQRLRRSPPAP